MVIGSGMIAKAFAGHKDDDNVLIFASGVANSGETDPALFARERSALSAAMQAHRQALLVYFSTCSVHDADVAKSAYVQHKLRMEEFIAKEQKRYLICRLPQVVGRSSNRTTLVNFLYDKVVSGEPFKVWKHAVRYLVDVDDVVRIVDALLRRPEYHNRIVTISGLGCGVMDIVKALEIITKARGAYILVDKGAPFQIGHDEIRSVLGELGLSFDQQYLSRILKKYYSGDSLGK